MTAVKRPGGLLDQHNLLQAVIRSDGVTLRDVETADVIIERYFQKHGNSRVSLSYLEQATGGKRERLAASVRKLVDMGVFAVARKGAGTRPTEYIPNFDYTLVVPKMGTTKGSELVIPNMGTAVVPKVGTATAASSPQLGDPNLLTEPAYSRHTESRTNTHGAATPPPVSGLTPSPAESPRDPKEGFDELWEAYGHKHKRADAKDAYDRLAPGAELQATLVAKAGQWCEQSQANNVDPKWRKTLVNWLKGECWHEDPPLAYEDPKQAAIAKAKDRGPRKSRKETPTAQDTAEPAAFDGLSPGAPIGRHVVRIVHCDITGDYAESIMSVRLRVYGGEKDGTAFEHKFYVTSKADRFQEEGLRYFHDIRKAVGVPNPEDTTELVGLVLAATISPGGAVKYEAGGNIAAQQAAAAKPAASMIVH